MCKAFNNDSPCNYNIDIYTKWNEYHLECVSNEQLGKLYKQAWDEYNRIADIYESDPNENTGYNYAVALQKCKEIEKEMEIRY